jgi:hypothetical protein
MSAADRFSCVKFLLAGFMQAIMMNCNTPTLDAAHNDIAPPAVIRLLQMLKLTGSTAYKLLRLRGTTLLGCQDVAAYYNCSAFPAALPHALVLFVISQRCAVALCHQIGLPPTQANTRSTASWSGPNRSHHAQCSMVLPMS